MVRPICAVKYRPMKIAKTLCLMAAIAVTTTRVIAGPGFLGAGTNLINTNFCNTNILGTNALGTNFNNPLAQYDLDGDCVITSNELATVSSNMVQALESKFLEEFDADHDGNVTTNEAAAVFQAAAELWFTNPLARYGVNHDGSITA